MTGAELVVAALKQQGIQTVFGYPGGAIMPIYDALYDGGVEHILCRHEQGAAMAAIGMARATQDVAVCMATSGPGATNLVTGLADAFLDSIPLVAITGQVASSHIGTDAFQEMDVIGMSLACTKHSYLVTDIEELAPTLAEAFEVAKTGRPGPVIVDIAKDVQLAQTPVTVLPPFTPPPAPRASDDALVKAQTLLSQSTRPVLYVGGGVQLAKATHAVREFLRLNPMPTVSTLKGLGTIERHDPHYLGMLGMHGTKAANLVVQECDLLIAVGARFDDRVTGKLDTFAPHAKVIHIDIDAAEIHKLREAHAPLRGEIVDLLPKLELTQDISPWVHHSESLRSGFKWRYDHPGELIYAPLLLKQLSDMMPDSAIVSTDVGQHQMWAAQFLGFEQPNRWMTSGGLGTMGYGLPASIGVQIAHPESLVINVAGEASWLMNMQEMGTAVQFRLPVKQFILNNERLGMVRQWQELLHGERYSQSWSEALPDFVKLAEAFGAKGILCKDPKDLDDAIMEMLDYDGPVIFDCLVEKHENCFPMIPSGKAHNEMLLGDADTQGVIDSKGSVLV